MVDFALATLVSSRLDLHAESAWGIIVGPPSTAKTESIRAFAQLPYTYVIDEINDKALNSHFQGTDEPSLLTVLDEKVLLWPELTTMITQNPQQAAAVMGQLRRTFDGQGYNRSTGVGSKHINSRFGILACCTDRIDQFLLDTATLGDRFIKVRTSRTRMSREEKSKYSDHVREASSNKKEWRDGLVDLADRHLSKYAHRQEGLSRPTVSPAQWRIFQAAVFMVADARMLPPSKGPVFLQEPEGPARLQQQIENLVGARCLLDSRTSWNADDLAFGVRVALDTLPLSSTILLATLARSKTFLGTEEIARRVACAPDRLTAVLSQFQHAGLLVRDPKGKWAFAEETRTDWEFADLDSALPGHLQE